MEVVTDLYWDQSKFKPYNIMHSTAIVFLLLAFFVILQDGAAAAENENLSNICSADTNKANSDITKKSVIFLILLKI